LRHSAADHRPPCIRPRGASHRRLDRSARLRARGRVRPLPPGVGGREHARVPRVAGCGVPRPALAVPVLGETDLVAASANLGDPRHPRCCTGGAFIRRHRDGARRRGGLRRDRHPARPSCPLRRPRQGNPLSDVNSLRVFFGGGLISYRALFSWLNPWVYIPSFLVMPIFQILLFVYIGRSAKLQSDSFYVIGNALQFAAIPCLFAMANTIAGERNQQTLGYILITPARRLPLFLGRAIPVAANGFFVALFALVAGSAIVGTHIAASGYAPIVLVIAVSAFACT